LVTSGEYLVKKIPVDTLFTPKEDVNRQVANLPGKSFLNYFRRLQLKRKHVVLLFFLFAGLYIAKAQCLASPALPGCNPAGSSPLVNNDVVGAGQVRTVNANGSFGSLTISGGTLIVCGNFSVTSFVFSSGVIFINTGASMMVNHSTALVFGNNCSIYNFGTFTSMVSIVTGQNNIISNASTSSMFTVAFNQFIVQGPGTSFINNGIFNSSFFIVQSNNSPGPICSGAGSIINTQIMINQYANAFTSPDGPSCINITQQIINNQPMTATPNVRICYMAGSVNIIGSPNFGNATVNNNCSGCAVALPLHIVSFDGLCDDHKVFLEWKTKDEAGADHFDVERSYDGIKYETIAKVQAEHTGNQFTTYRFGSEMNDLGPNVFYYRLKQVDLSGEFFHSKVISVNCNTELELNVAPSITENYFTVSSIYTLDLVTVYDAAGRLVHTSYYNNEHFFTTVVNNTLARGVYLVRVRTSNGKLYNRKVVFI
jgi:hypothetical protein